MYFKTLTIGMFKNNNLRSLAGLFIFYLFILKILFIYFREGKGGRETLICGCLLHTPHWGHGLQPRHVP